MTTERATDVLDALMSSTIELLSTMALLPRMWQLRHDLTGYDAAYIAAAEAYDCPRSPVNARLSRLGGLRCEIRLATPTD